MRYLKNILIAIIGLTAQYTLAQQDPKNAFYTYQMTLINPAYAGSEEKIDITLGVRSYWTNVKGAPESQSLVFAMPVGKNVGIGVSILNDKTFIEKQTKIALDYGYKIKLNRKNYFLLGIKASIGSYNANTNGLTSYAIQHDASLQNIQGGFSPNVGAGVYLKLEKYFLSLSVPGLLTSKRLNEINGSATYSEARRHFYLATGYNFTLSDKVLLKASTIVRYVPYSPISIDLTGELSLSKKINLGAFYSTDSVIGGMFVFKASEKLRVGYAYDMAINGAIRGINNGTNEIFLKLSL